MKTISRRMIGLTSSMLAVAGLMQAAERLDPLTQSIARECTVRHLDERPADGCVYPCMYSPEPGRNFHT